MAFEAERLGHHADRQRAGFASQLRNDGRGAGAGAAAHAGGHEHHVRALHDVFQALHVFQSGLATALRIRAGTEAARDVGADGNLFSGRVTAEGLRVGVHGDELHAFEAEVNHRVDGVSARTAHADHLDTRVVGACFVCKFD